MMKPNEFTDALKGGGLSGVYLMAGPEEYLKESDLRLVRETLLPPGFEMLNESVFEGCGMDVISESAETMPFMCDKRLVIAKDPAPLMSNITSKDNPDCVKLEKMLGSSYDACVILLYVRGEARDKNALVSLLAKRGRTVDYELLSEAELAKWAGNRIKELGHSIKTPALNELVYASGRRMQKLDTEIGKLCGMAGSRKEITADDVRELVIPDVEVRIFAFIDLLIGRKAADAYRLLDKLLDSGENEVRILSLITRQLRLYAHCAVLYEAGLTDAEAAKKLSENYNYPFKKTYSACRGMSVTRLVNCYRKSVEADCRIKNGTANARPVLEEMMYLLYDLKR